MSVASIAARTLSKSKLYGVLATNSHSMPGYPFGSLVQYCFDNNGHLLLFLSEIAQHTKNIKQSKQASVTIVDDKVNNIQAAGRVTILGEIYNCDNDNEAKKLYQRFFADSTDYTQVHDFQLYRLQIERVRYIGGFGDIHWIKQDDFLNVQNFSATQVLSAIEHMNNDHQSAIRKYSLNAAQAQQSTMLHFDQEGMWLDNDSQIEYIPFKYPAVDLNSLRQVLSDMAKNTLTN